MHKHGRLIYSDEERDYIERNYKAKTYRELAVILGRSYCAIATYCSDHNLHKNRNNRHLGKPKTVKKMKLTLSIKGKKKELANLALIAAQHGLKVSYK